MHKIESYDELSALLERFTKKGSHTNNYLLQEAYLSAIHQGRLLFLISGENLVLLLDNDDFFKVYFHLNDLNRSIDLPAVKPLVMEIPYRGLENKPQHLIGFWQHQGFREHLSRDNMISKWSDLILPAFVPDSIQLRLADSITDVLFAKELFDNTLDHFTGDRMSVAELSICMEKGQLICAQIENDLAGVLHFEHRNNVVWLGHIAVNPNHRGKGVANTLVQDYLLRNKRDENTRYALWVIQDNVPATKLYRNFGFVYGNKSTVSMLKMS